MARSQPPQPPDPSDSSDSSDEKPALPFKGAGAKPGAGAGAGEAPPDLMRIARGTRYPLSAFEFVLRGLEFTSKRVHGESRSKGAIGEPKEDRHVTGQQLSAGLRDYAIEQYGLLARFVLRRWNITRTEDFGQIVFAMVDAKALGHKPEDNIHDFDGVFDFEEAFASLSPIIQPRE